MRKSLLPLLAATILFCGCENTGKSSPAESLATKRKNDEANLNQALNRFDVPAQVFSAPGDQVSLIRGKKGSVLFLTPADLETADGQAPGKNIIVELKEVTTQAELARANAQTVSNGDLLMSGGAYYINLTSDGKQLQLKKNRDLKVAFPRITDSAMSLYYGDRDTQGHMNWQPTNEPLTAKNGYSVETGDTTGAKSIMVYNPMNYKLMGYVGSDSTYRQDTALLRSMKNTAKFAEAEARITEYINKRFSDSAFKAKRKPFIEASERLEKNLYDIKNIKRLGWLNVDNLFPNTTRTNITYTIDPKDSIMMARIYLVYKDINSTVTNNYYWESENGTRELNFIPIGYKARLIAVSSKNNELLVCKMDLTIKDNQHTVITWKKTTPEELNSYFNVNNGWGQ